MKPVGSKTAQALIDGERVTKYIQSPRQVGSMDAWERQVRRTFQINDEFTLLRASASNFADQSYIGMEFVNNREQRIKVSIDRKS